MSIWLSASVYTSISCCTLRTVLFLTLLLTALWWFILLHPLHFFPYAGHLWGGWLDPQYLHVLFWFCCGFCLYFFALVIILHQILGIPLSNSEVLFVFFGPLLTFPKEVLVTSLFSPFVSSIVISTIMPLSFRLWINWSFNYLPISF